MTLWSHDLRAGFKDSERKRPDTVLRPNSSTLHVIYNCETIIIQKGRVVCVWGGGTVMTPKNPHKTIMHPWPYNPYCLLPCNVPIEDHQPQIKTK